MLKRRYFLKLSAMFGAGISASALLPGCAAVAAPKRKPVVISTWDFGMQANEVAFALLQQGARAVDAVQQGVMLTEADPTERSVGYGGRPDRDGKVTLDACIMDEFANIGAVAALQQIKHPVAVARAVARQRLSTRPLWAHCNPLATRPVLRRWRSRSGWMAANPSTVRRPERVARWKRQVLKVGRL